MALWLEGVSLLVLLVAIANVINLQMSRAAQQRREMAVRAALGAGRGRLLSKLMLEVLAIAAGGAAVGVALTWWSATALHQLLMPGVPASSMAGASGWSPLATIVVATMLVVGVASLQVGVDAIGAQLKTGRGGDGFSRARLRQGLLVAQVVMSALLLVGAGLFMRSIMKIGELQFGMDHGPRSGGHASAARRRLLGCGGRGLLRARSRRARERFPASSGRLPRTRRRLRRRSDRRSRCLASSARR